MSLSHLTLKPFILTNGSSIDPSSFTYLTVSYLTIIAVIEHASNTGKNTKIDAYTGEIEHTRGKKNNIVKAKE